MNKLTDDDLRFALANFDEHGWLFGPTEEQLAGVRSLMYCGHARQKYHCGREKWGYVVSLYVASHITAAKLSNLVGTVLVPCVPL